MQRIGLRMRCCGTSWSVGRAKRGEAMGLSVTRYHAAAAPHVAGMCAGT